MYVASFIHFINLRRTGWRLITLLLILLFHLLCLLQFFTCDKFTAKPVKKVIYVKECCLGLALSFHLTLTFFLWLLIAVKHLLFFNGCLLVCVWFTIYLCKIHLLFLVFLFLLNEIIIEMTYLHTILIKKCVKAIW
jgi:hypothetical protein